MSWRIMKREHGHPKYLLTFGRWTWAKWNALTFDSREEAELARNRLPRTVARRATLTFDPRDGST